jgi:hypothetical protein
LEICTGCGFMVGPLIGGIFYQIGYLLFILSLNPIFIHVFSYLKGIFSTVFCTWRNSLFAFFDFLFYISEFEFSIRISRRVIIAFLFTFKDTNILFDIGISVCWFVFNGFLSAFNGNSSCAGKL